MSRQTVLSIRIALAIFVFYALGCINGIILSPLSFSIMPLVIVVFTIIIMMIMIKPNNQKEAEVIKKLLIFSLQRKTINRKMIVTSIGGDEITINTDHTPLPTQELYFNKTLDLVVLYLGEGINPINGEIESWFTDTEKKGAYFIPKNEFKMLKKL